MICPTCKQYRKQRREMRKRPVEHQSEEQLWCGQWFDCNCKTSILIPSKALKAQLAEQKARLAS